MIKSQIKIITVLAVLLFSQTLFAQEKIAKEHWRNIKTKICNTFFSHKT